MILFTVGVQAAPNTTPSHTSPNQNEAHISCGESLIILGSYLGLGGVWMAGGSIELCDTEAPKGLRTIYYILCTVYCIPLRILIVSCGLLEA